MSRCTLLLNALALSLASAAQAGKQTAAPTFENTVQPFLARSCFTCHSAKLKSGELDLQHHAQPGQALKNRDVWESVVAKIRSGEMPPKGLPRPKPEEITHIANFIDREYARQDRLAKPDPGRVTARRLNRYEYNNTIRDLLGVDFQPAESFPADDSGYGFDNIGDVLSLSPVLMEKYLTAAEAIARRAIVAERTVPRATRAQIRAETVAMGEHLMQKELPPGVHGPLPSPGALHIRHKFPAEGEYEVRVVVGGVVRGATVPMKLGFWIDGNATQTLEFDPGPNAKRNLELRVPLKAGEHRVSAAFLEDVPDLGLNRPTDRKLSIDLFEIRGPFQPVQPALPLSHRQIVACGHDLNAHTEACARTLISPLVRRAFRRNPRPAEAVRYLRLFDAARADGETFEGALRVALQAILVSPHFLFRIERDANPIDAAAAHPINDYELASRLSYFLWSSMPDDELLNLAAQNQLRPNLSKQVRRMLADERSNALAGNFAGQWLQLRNLDEAKPDPERFPGFDDDLRVAMKRETELFFDAIVKEDRSILDFLDARFTYLNERLALHYGIDGVTGPEFRRVALTGDQRSGVLTHASVLTVSSYPTRTSPVIRGKWVLENLLNAPPPPPPPGVPNLDEAAVGNTGSLRQQLERHRSDAACASCHARMDPLGFGLENYDAIGAWRTKDGKFPIDVAGTLPDGKSFQSPLELKTILRGDKGAFARALTEKLLTYALGRGLERFDKPAVQSISRQLAARDYRFSVLVMGIVESMPFRMRRGENMDRTALQ